MDRKQLLLMIKKLERVSYISEIRIEKHNFPRLE